VLLFMTLAMVGGGSAIAASATTGASSSGEPGSGGTQSVSQWQQAQSQVPEPTTGCYDASYPSAQWVATTCAVAPKIPFAPVLPSQTTGSDGKPGTVGNGVDYSAQVNGLITQTTGTFTDVSPGISETGQAGGVGPEVPNEFSLQLNSEFFSSPACAGAHDPSRCLGWQQFVYTTDPNLVFMQYWLINYNVACPTGWFNYYGDCYTNSPAQRVPDGPLTASDLASTQLEGSADQGGNDQATVYTGVGRAAMVSNPDSVVDLASYWNTSEFGVYGDGGGSEAYFGANTTIDAQSVIGGNSFAPPQCVNEGFTGETNNLTLSGTPSISSQGSPAMSTQQTNGDVTTASCATASGGIPQDQYNFYYKWSGSPSYSETTLSFYPNGSFYTGDGVSGIRTLNGTDITLYVAQDCEPTYRGVTSSSGLNSKSNPGTMSCSAYETGSGNWYATLVSSYP
jgi:hypothetical protein